MVAEAVELLVAYLVPLGANVVIKLQEVLAVDVQEDKGRDMLVTGHALLLAEANLILARFRLKTEWHAAVGEGEEINLLVPFQLSNAVVIPDVAEDLA